MLLSIIIRLCSKLLVVVVVLLNCGCDALRMINLDAPEWAIQGDTIELSCSFALEQHKQRLEPKSHSKSLNERFNFSQVEVASEQHQRQPFEVQEFASSERLYAIKWFKDGREFFRYLTDDWPKKQPLPVDGVTLAEDKSDNHTVVLKSVSLKTSGLYRCEVSTDAPTFVTESREKRLRIYSLPQGGPKIEVASIRETSLDELVLNEYELKGAVFTLGNQFRFTCTVPDSKPAVSLHWIINDTLNLSTLMPAQLNSTKSSVQFSLENKRLIRPLTSVGIPIGTVGLSSSIIINKSRVGGGKQQQQPLTNHYSKQALTYELLNDTLAFPIEHNSLAAPINLSPNLLDQLTESSSSRLNLSVDSNLFRILQASSRPKLTTNPPVLSTAAQKLQLAKETAKSFTSQSAKTKSTFSSSPYTSQPVSSQVDKEASTVTHKAQQRLSNSLGLSAAADRPSKTKHWMMRVKCIASALHLTMTDEVKLRFINERTTTNKNDRSQTSSTARHNQAVQTKSSAASTSNHREDKLLVIILMLITATCTEVYSLYLK